VNPFKKLFKSQTPGSTASAQESLPQISLQPFLTSFTDWAQIPSMQNTSEEYPKDKNQFL